MKKIIIVDIENIDAYPPVLTVLNCCAELKTISVVLCTLNASDYIKKFCEMHNVKLLNINDVEYKSGSSLYSSFNRYTSFHKIQSKLWDAIESVYDDETAIWVCSILTMRYLGKRLLKTKYILHLFELVEKLYYTKKIPIMEINLKEYCQCAACVVECEYNRAHITKVWFDLDKTPVVLPNKLYLLDSVDYSEMIPERLRHEVNQLKDKKIILYQGGITKERPINKFIDALDYLDNNFVMLIMGNNLDSIKKHDRTFLIPFIPAPYHLYVTQKARIGILCYLASSKGFSFTSPLNSIYCAPNKIYEYSKFSIPMIGNDIPGLKYTIESYNMGVCTDVFDPIKIAADIEKIEKEYDVYSNNAQLFYNDCDVKTIIINEILTPVLSV